MKPAELKTLVAVLLVTAAVLYPTLRNDFVPTWDDGQYIQNCQAVQSFNISEMFGTFHVSGNYHPLSLLSLAIDYKLGGLAPFGFHLTNLLVHLLNVLLVFLLVRSLTGRLEIAGFVALLFGIHPMHVESVAWIAERKDVLYSAFFLSSLIAYLDRKLPLCLGLFILALLSKSAAVVLPLCLLLIDFWQGRKLKGKVLREKIPFFGLSFIFGIVAILSQSSGGSVSAYIEGFPVLDRMLISCYAVAFYIIKAIAPFNLSAFYPQPDRVLPWQYYLAPLVLMALGALVWRCWKNRAVVFGAGFFLVNILLIIQIVPVGSAIVAERYSYLAYVGLFLIVAQGAIWLYDRRRWVAIAVLAPICFWLSVLTWERSQVWSDGVTLLTDAIEKDSRSGLAYLCRGLANQKMNQNKWAMQDFNAAIDVAPGLTMAYACRGVLQVKYGNYEDAVRDFDMVLVQNPNFPEMQTLLHNRAEAAQKLKETER